MGRESSRGKVERKRRKWWGGESGREREGDGESVWTHGSEGEDMRRWKKNHTEKDKQRIEGLLNMYEVTSRSRSGQRDLMYAIATDKSCLFLLASPFQIALSPFHFPSGPVGPVAHFPGSLSPSPKTYFFPSWLAPGLTLLLRFPPSSLLPLSTGPVPVTHFTTSPFGPPPFIVLLFLFSFSFRSTLNRRLSRFIYFRAASRFSAPASSSI